MALIDPCIHLHVPLRGTLILQVTPTHQRLPGPNHPCFPGDSARSLCSEMNEVSERIEGRRKTQLFRAAGKQSKDHHVAVGRVK